MLNICFRPCTRRCIQRAQTSQCPAIVTTPAIDAIKPVPSISIGEPIGRITWVAHCSNELLEQFHQFHWRVFKCK